MILEKPNGSCGKLTWHLNHKKIMVLDLAKDSYIWHRKAHSIKVKLYKLCSIKLKLFSFKGHYKESKNTTNKMGEITYLGPYVKF